MDAKDSFQTFSFRGTSTSRDAPNPLRPYYIPPSIGLPPPEGPGAPPATSHSNRSSFPAAARELFSDIDYESYIPDRNQSSSGAGDGVADVVKRIVDQAIWNYTSVLLAQPFEVAKVVLQCYQADSAVSVERRVPGTPSVGSMRGGHSNNGSVHEPGYFDTSDDSDDDGLPSYFTATAPYETPSSPSRSRRRGKPPSRSLSATPTPSSHSSPTQPPSHSHSIELKRNDSLVEVLTQIWSKEGAWGVWKGTNSTFVYNVLLRTIETWTRSLLSAALDLPDATLLAMGSPAGSISILDSPSPIASIAVAVSAAGIAGLVLAPIDMVRTRYVLPFLFLLHKY